MSLIGSGRRADGATSAGSRHRGDAVVGHLVGAQDQAGDRVSGVPARAMFRQALAESQA